VLNCILHWFARDIVASCLNNNRNILLFVHECVFSFSML